MEKGKRIDWVDYYKALAIILVVIAHTGQLTPYIFQFHPAAFFFISGVVAGLEKKDLEEVIILKFFTLILPYIFFMTWYYVIFDILQRLGVLKYVSVWETVPGLFSNISHMFNTQYSDWMGALWFLTTLFVSTLTAKLCLMANNNKCGIIFVGLFMFLFLMGYHYHKLGYSPIFVNRCDHFLIVQAYFSLGILFRWVYEHVKIKIPVFVTFAIAIINIVLFWVFKAKGFTMDLATTTVNNAKTDLVTACNGIIFLFCISVLMCYIPGERIKKGLSYLGRNTFGILIFHLIGFKLVTFILSLFGVCGFNEISKLLPPSEITNIWWPLYLIGTIAFSLAVWELINKFRWVRFFTGLSKESYKAIYNRYKGLYQDT